MARTPTNSSRVFLKGGSIFHVEISAPVSEGKLVWAQGRYETSSRKTYFLRTPAGDKLDTIQITDPQTTEEETIHPGEDRRIVVALTTNDGTPDKQVTVELILKDPADLVHTAGLRLQGVFVNNLFKAVYRISGA